MADPLASLPWRGPGEDRPDLPLPPARMPLRDAGTHRKRWRYVAAFAEPFTVCAASQVARSIWSPHPVVRS